MSALQVDITSPTSYHGRAFRLTFIVEYYLSILSFIIAVICLSGRQASVMLLSTPEKAPIRLCLVFECVSTG